MSHSMAIPLFHAKVHKTLLRALMRQQSRQHGPQPMSAASLNPDDDRPPMSPPEGGFGFLQILSVSGPWDSACGPTAGLNAEPSPVHRPSSEHPHDPSDRALSTAACVLRALMSHIGPTAGCVIESWLQSGWEAGKSCEIELPKEVGENRVGPQSCGETRGHSPDRRWMISVIIRHDI